VAVGGSTVYRTKRRFVEGNLERALSEDPRPGAERKLTGKEKRCCGEACAASRGSRPLDAGALAGAMVSLPIRESVARNGAPALARSNFATRSHLRAVLTALREQTSSSPTVDLIARTLLRCCTRPRPSWRAPSTTQNSSTDQRSGAGVLMFSSSAEWAFVRDYSSIIHT